MVRDGTIKGRGYNKIPETLNAEVMAINEAGEEDPGARRHLFILDVPEKEPLVEGEG